MNIPFTVLMQILIIHFLADFALQTHEQATKKSTDNIFLVYHVGTYSLCWLFASMVIFPATYRCIPFAMITFICHFITDWITSRINKTFFDKQNYHDGFVGVGYDQVFHYTQLILTYLLLSK